MQLYRAWEPLTEGRFLGSRLDKNQLTPERWLVLLDFYQGGRLDRQQTARGLVTLTKLMLKGVFLEHQGAIGRYMINAEATVYQAEVSPALPPALPQAKKLFQAWWQVPAFQEPLACRELTHHLLDLLVQHDLAQALDFVAKIWPHFSIKIKPTSRATEPSRSRHDFLATCVQYTTSADDAKQLIELSWQLSGLTRSDWQLLHGAAGLSQLPLSKRLVTLLASVREREVREEPSLLYQAYQKEWESDPKFLFGIMAIALDRQQSNLLQQLWEPELVRLTQERAIRADSAYMTLLIRLLDEISQERLTRMAEPARRQYARLACLFGRFEGITTMLHANLSDRAVTEAWLDDLHLLFGEQNDSAWMEAQVKRLVSAPKWRHRAVQLRFDDALRVADALQWHPLAQPAIMQAMQLLQQFEAQITLLPTWRDKLWLWFDQKQPESATARQLLIRHACRDAVRGDKSWSDVAEWMFGPPTGATNVAWLRDNLKALLTLPLSERMQTGAGRKSWVEQPS